MSLWLLPKEMIAEISRLLPDEPGSNMVRKYANGIIIKDVRDGLTYYNGLLHNYMEAPAIINGCQIWCYYGRPHRENGPAFINSNGIFWFHHGLLHNEDGPSVIIGDSQLWYKFGLLHSYNGDPAIWHADGSHEYYTNGLLHRDDAHAIYATGDICYYYIAGEFIKKENPYNWKSWYPEGISRYCNKGQTYRILQAGKFVV